MQTKVLRDEVFVARAGESGSASVAAHRKDTSSVETRGRVTVVDKIDAL